MSDPAPQREKDGEEQRGSRRALFGTPRTQSAISRLTRPPGMASPALSPIKTGRTVSVPTFDLGSPERRSSAPRLSSLRNPKLSTSVEDSAGLPLPYDVYSSPSLSPASPLGPSRHNRRVTDLDSPDVVIEESVEEDGSVSVRHMQRTDRVERVRMTVLEEEGTPETFNDLLQLLQDPNGIKAFATFLDDDRANSLVFWAACEDHKKLRGDVALGASATAICEQHVVANCPFPIPLSAATAKTLSFHAPNADVAFFTRAQREILYVLRKEYLLFVKSEMFEHWQDNSGVFEDLKPVNTSGSPLNPTKKKRGRKITMRKIMKTLNPTSKAPAMRRTVSSPVSRRRPTQLPAANDRVTTPDDSLMVRLFLWDLILPKDRNTESLGVHQYHKLSKKEAEGPYEHHRHMWAAHRELSYAPSKRTSRLAGKLSDYLEIADKYRSIYVHWMDRRIALILYDDGSVVNFALKAFAPDLEAISIDQKFCMKMQDRNFASIANACVMRDFLVITFLSKPGVALYSLRKDKTADEDSLSSSGSGGKPEQKEKSATFSDSVLDASQRKRPSGHVAVNSSQDMVMLWWPRPDPNFHAGGNMTLMSFDASERRLVPRASNRPTSEIFDLWWSNRSVDQLYVAFGSSNDLLDCHVQLSIYEAWSEHTEDASMPSVLKSFKSPGSSKAKNGIAHVESFKISLPSPPAVLSLSPDETKLLVISIRGEITLYFLPNDDEDDEELVRKPIVKASVMRNPALVSWHPNNAVVVVASRGGTIQCFDMTLTPVWLTIASDSPLPSISLNQITDNVRGLQLASWVPHVNLPYETATSLQTVKRGVDQLLLVPEHGAAMVIQVMLGVSTNALTPYEVVCERLNHSQIKTAVGILKNLDWLVDAPLGYQCFVAIFDHLMKLPFSPMNNESIRAAFPTFSWRVFSRQPISQPEYREKFRNLFWRYFSSLLRQGQIDFALLLAAELRCREMFLALSLAVKELEGDSAHLVAAIAKTGYDQCMRGDTSQTSLV